MRRLVVLLALVLSLAIPVPPASAADATWYPDADDSSSALDLRLVGLTVRGAGRVTVTIKTFERIDLPEDGQLWAQFDSWGGPRWDYGFHIWFDGGSDGTFCDWRDRVGRVNPLIGWDVEGRTAHCRFRARQIAVDKPVRWRVFSTALMIGEPRVREIEDRAPDGGAWFPGISLPEA